MKILVTGPEGQVARSLVERAQGHEGIEIEAVGLPELDLTNPQTVFYAIEKRRPDLVVSAAAYTDVDRAEDEPELAMTVNAAGAGAVARAAEAAGAPVIHLSTDYVFSGDLDRSYAEDDGPDPQSVYGRSKLAGEREVAAANSRYIILRTAWVYSPFGRNFVKTMLRLAGERSTVSVVSDQTGNPSSALDLADGILNIAATLGRGPHSGLYGIFHMVGTGATTWNGFAEHIFAASRAAGGPSAEVTPIATADYPAKARRPANSRLSTGKLERVYGWRAPDWQASVTGVVHRLLAENVAT